jgi:hypothetical protein
MENVIIKMPAGRLCIQEAKCINGCLLMNPDKLFEGKAAITADVRIRGNTGKIHLSPFFGDFKYECDLELNDDDMVDLYCPHCNASLTTDENCSFCEVPMFAIHLRDGGEVRACPVVGCQNHQLIIMDLDAQFADFYNEERRPKM